MTTRLWSVKLALKFKSCRALRSSWINMSCARLIIAPIWEFGQLICRGGDYDITPARWWHGSDAAVRTWSGSAPRSELKGLNLMSRCLGSYQGSAEAGNSISRAQTAWSSDARLWKLMSRWCEAWRTFWHFSLYLYSFCISPLLQSKLTEWFSWSEILWCPVPVLNHEYWSVFLKLHRNWTKYVFE